MTTAPSVTRTTRDRSVLLVGNFLSHLGGSVAVCEELAYRMAGRGWRVGRASTQPNRVLRLLDMTWKAWSLRDRYQVAQVDVFSGGAFFWAEATCWVLRRAGRPYVLTLHGGNLPRFAERWPSRVGHLLGSATAVTAPSGYLLNSMRRFRPDILLLPNAIEIRDYPFRLRTAAEPRLIWLRSFHEIYNPNLAIRVLALVSQTHSGAMLTMIGRDKEDGSYQQARALAAELGIAGRIRFVPGIGKREVPEWLQKADIFLNTSRIDNTPVSVLEAMACGLCVISTDCGGLCHLVGDGEDGLLAPSDDAVALAAGVRRILDEPALASQLSRRARQKAEAVDWPPILDRWEDLLGRLARYN